MKTSIAVVLAAVVSSLVTVGSIELLRGPGGAGARAGGERSAGSPQGRTERELEALVPERSAVESTVAATAGLHNGGTHEDRLRELEDRIAALELGARSNRTPATPAEAELPPKDELRTLVLDWVAEEREARGRNEALEAEAKELEELEFGARYQAREFAQQHHLAAWQEAEFAELFRKIALRAREIEQDIDLADGPELAEARWEEFDEWCDQLERELTARLDPAVYEEIYGED